MLPNPRGNMELKISYCTKAGGETGLLNGMELSTTYTNRGLGYREKGDHERALEDYDSAIRITPDNDTSRRLWWRREFILFEPTEGYQSASRLPRQQSCADSIDS